MLRPSPTVAKKDLASKDCRSLIGIVRPLEIGPRIYNVHSIEFFHESAVKFARASKRHNTENNTGGFDGLETSNQSSLACLDQTGKPAQPRPPRRIDESGTPPV